MTNNNRQSIVDTFVAELLMIDPTLKEREGDIRQVASLLLEKKPNIVPDAQFVARLREELRATSPDRSFSEKLWQLFRTPAPAAFVVAALLLLVGVNIVAQKKTSDTVSLAYDRRVEAVSAGSFGSLAGQASSPAAPLGSTAAMSARAEAAPGAMNMVDSKMIMPMVQFSYRYMGDPLELPTDVMSVYRRKKGAEASASPLLSIIARSFPGINLNGLSGLRMQYATLVQSGTDGYTVGVDFDDSRLTINPNYQTWYPSDSVPTPLSPSEVLSDEEIIALASAFLDARGVKRSLYGEPIVDHSWKVYYDAATAENKYVPDSLSVTYPTMFGKYAVKEGYGDQAYGLRVTVDLRKKKVQGVWNLTSEMYESSVYPLVTDTANVLALAEKGGSMYTNPWMRDMEIKKETLDLGTPTLVYTQQYVYDEKTGRSDELYAPSLSFPVISKPTSEWSAPVTIIVPLVQELVDERMNPGESGGPEIVPMLR